jgi:geranylgeranyl pyrophosphate synthase
MNDLVEFFERSRVVVERVLEEFIEMAAIEPAVLREAVGWSLFGGGKRFRPALVLAVGEAFGASMNRLINSAVAVELIHTYSLVHDDLPAMDDDDLRRGRETCHVKFGEATAILAGDLLQVLASRAITDDRDLPDSVCVQLVSELATATSRMIAGQQMDLQSEGRQTASHDLEAIHKNKTGALICWSARAGALVGGANRDELRAITKYAATLGLLFQITDDILDVTQTADKLGKTAAKDIAAAKATYPGIHGLDRSRAMLVEIRAEALSYLDEIERPTEILAEMVDFIVRRES